MAAVLYLALQVCKTKATMEADTGDMMVDQQEPVDETRLPNSHSAALVMGFIFLCVLAYGVYRFIKFRCGEQKMPLTVSLDGHPNDCAVDGLEDIMKQREAYLAIYGPKNVSSVSGAVSKNERTGGPNS